MIHPSVKHAARAAALALACATAQAATYQYTGASFTNFGNYTAAPCAAGSCANFTTAMAATGTFSTVVPLAASLPPGTDISADITAFSFSDGLTTYSSSDPTARLMYAIAETDATGAVTAIAISLRRWQTGTPAAVGGRIDMLSISPTGISGFHNAYCEALRETLTKAAATGCLTISQDVNTSTGRVNTASVPVPAPAPSPATVPALSGAGLVGLSALLGLFGRRARRGKAQG